MSATGVNGLNNALFFKEIWPFTKKDFYRVVRYFFQFVQLYAPISCTNITLIPKSSHAETIKQYRPILCCSVIYKMILKVLAKIL